MGTFWLFLLPSSASVIAQGEGVEPELKSLVSSQAASLSFAGGAEVRRPGLDLSPPPTSIHLTLDRFLSLCASVSRP